MKIGRTLKIFQLVQSIEMIENSKVELNLYNMDNTIAAQTGKLILFRVWQNISDEQRKQIYTAYPRTRKKIRKILKDNSELFKTIIEQEKLAADKLKSVWPSPEITNPYYYEGDLAINGFKNHTSFNIDLQSKYPKL